MASHPVPSGQSCSDVVVTRSDGSQYTQPAYSNEELAEITAPPWLREMRARAVEKAEDQ